MATMRDRAHEQAGRAAAPAYDAVLGPDERLVGRPFTDPEATAEDALVMARLLALEREVALTWGPDVEGPNIAEQIRGETRRLLAVPDGRALLAARDVTAVGFFGRLREGVDHEPLFAHERAITRTFPDFAPLGFLSYLDVGPEHGSYGNLILFWTPDVPPAWRRNPAHRAAVAEAPRHYHHIRLHAGRIPGPFMGNGTVDLSRTQYLDFDGPSPWRGLRLHG